MDKFAVLSLAKTRNSKTLLCWQSMVHEFSEHHEELVWCEEHQVKFNDVQDIFFDLTCSQNVIFGVAPSFHLVNQLSWIESAYLNELRC